MAKARILLVDDHAVLRAGLAMLINAQPDMEVVGEAQEGADAIDKTRLLRPDVVLLDLTLPGMNGFDALRELVRLDPPARVLVLTMHDDPAYRRHVLAAGALGFVTKRAADRELLTAIRAVREGRSSADITPGEALARRSSRRGPRELLSPREEAVLALIAQGFTHGEIAARLTLSIKTVETYLARLSQKLGLKRRADLVRYAWTTGLVGEGLHLPPGDAPRDE
jgi:DNA-binding NarL/FixJ family response regulator